MNTRRTTSRASLVAVATVAMVGGAGCAFSHQAVTPSTLGSPITDSAFEALIDEPGPVTVDTVSSARWAVQLSGLINLDSAEAKAAGLKDRSEPIVVDVHVIRHPKNGMFFVDTGVERAVTADPDHACIRGLVASIMKLDTMKVDHDTKSIIGTEKLAGVFLTHLHLDHVSGFPDIANDTPIYAGPHEPDEGSSLQNGVVGPNIDRCLVGKGPLREWQFSSDGLVDVFGDQTVFAIATPGHTKGSTAYLIRTPKGPVLLTGDTSHTVWGWEHNVEPGTFTGDQPQNRASLLKLKALVARHPSIEVRLGHQHLPSATAATATTIP